MRYISRLDGKFIDIDLEENTNYGVMLSGGLDSAILCFLILKTLLENNIPVSLQPFTIPKHDGAAYYINDIVQYFNSLMRIDLPETKIVGDPDVFHGDQSKVAVREIFQQYSAIDRIFFGTNQNPPPKFILPGTYPNRVKGSDDSRIALPFIDLYKTHILDLIYEYGQEKLIDITHSCTEQKKGRCGQCFQCHERIWAFKELDRIDTGLL